MKMGKYCGLRHAYNLVKHNMEFKVHEANEGYGIEFPISFL